MRSVRLRPGLAGSFPRLRLYAVDGDGAAGFHAVDAKFAGRSADASGVTATSARNWTQLE